MLPTEKYDGTSSHALVAHRLVQGSHQFYNPEVFHCICICLRFDCIIVIASPQNGSAVFLALPTQISHWFHYNH